MSAATPTTPDFDRIAVGDTLPGHSVAITLQRLVMEAGANRDFAMIHTDPVAAAKTGAPTAYANTIFLETLIEAALRGWAGPRAWIAEIGFTMRSFNCVGMTAAAGGTVTALHPDERVAELDIWVEADGKRTLEGTAKVEFPTSEESSDG
jgi:acyl dehydratase